MVSDALGNIEPFDHHRGRAPLLRPTAWWRVGVFTAVNLTAFAVVCAFWQYLSEGRWANFTTEAYLNDLKTSIGQIIVQPLGVLTYPWMIVVIGLLLAVTVFVPVVISVLYHLRLAALFVVLVAVVAHGPVLAFSVAIGCILAGRTRLRSDMPFAAFLLGMLPIAGYLYFLGFVGVDTVAVMPLQKWVLYAPFVLAVVAAVLAGAVVLALAKVTGFRPGAVWPVLAVMLLAPMATFYLWVGPDKLDYSLMVRSLAPGDAIFRPKPLSEFISTTSAGEIKAQTLRQSVLDDMRTRQDNLSSRCREFIKRYPRSRYAGRVLWLDAHCMTLQLDRLAYDSGTIAYTSRYSLPAGADTWRELVDNYGGTPQAALAKWRLAELELRSGKMIPADELLHDAHERLMEISAAARRRRSENFGKIFRKTTALPSDEYYENAMFSIELLMWLMEQNDVLDDPASAKALGIYLNENPNNPDYHAKLKKLARTYAKTKFSDNLVLAKALANPDLAATVETLVLLAQKTECDSAVQANYALGHLAMRKDIRKLIPQIETPQKYFQRVISIPASPWQKPAIEALIALGEEKGQADH